MLGTQDQSKGLCGSLPQVTKAQVKDVLGCLAQLWQEEFPGLLLLGGSDGLGLAPRLRGQTDLGCGPSCGA